MSVGVTYSTATAPLTAAQFADKNKIALAFYEIAIPSILGYFIRTKSATFWSTPWMAPSLMAMPTSALVTLFAIE